MRAYIDRRLADRISAAGESGPVEAVIVVEGAEGSCLGKDDGGLARYVVEGAVERTGDRPFAVRYFPRANAAVISATGRFIQEILKDENLAVASLPYVDTFPFSTAR
jgi:hypothetical protein